MSLYTAARRCGVSRLTGFGLFYLIGKIFIIVYKRAGSFWGRHCLLLFLAGCVEFVTAVLFRGLSHTFVWGFSVLPASYTVCLFSFFFFFFFYLFPVFFSFLRQFGVVAEFSVSTSSASPESSAVNGSAVVLNVMEIMPKEIPAANIRSGVLPFSFTQDTVCTARIPALPGSRSCPLSLSCSRDSCRPRSNNSVRVSFPS